MVQSYKSGRTFRVGPGLSFSKYFGPDKTFYSIKSNEFFFRGIDLLCSPR